MAKKPSNSAVLPLTNKDLEKHFSTIQKAKDMWSTRCAQYYEHRGDWGTVVIGAGIAIPKYIGPRKRKAVPHIIIYAADGAGPAQGCPVWEESVNDVVDFLKANGLKDAYYECGYMD